MNLMSFTCNVWNALEELNLIDQFSGTPKGIVTEIREYSALMEKDYKTQNTITDQYEYIKTRILRDMRK